MTRKFLECEPVLAEQVRLYCFLRQMTVKAFVTKAIEQALEPYKEWLKEVRELRRKERPPR